MNKKLFSGLVVLMALSLLGIVIVQIVWIDNAVRIKNELFDRSVNDALSNSVQKLENIQDVQFLTDFDGLEDISWNSHPAPPHPPHPVRIIRDKKMPADTRIEVLADDKNNQIQVFSFNDGDQLQTQSMIISQRDTIITTTKAIIEKNLARIDSLKHVIDTTTLSQGIKHRIKVRSERLKDLGNQVVTEFFSFDEDEIPIEKIQQIVKEELLNKQIPIPFDLAIEKNDTIREISENADSISLVQSTYKTDMFPHAIFKNTTKLSIHFPTQANYILKSIWWLLVLSFFFSLIILLTFSLSIWYMLRQKKISEMKSDFINNMTHEFKTPIATISIAADSITNQKVIDNPEKIRYFSEMIKKENARMNHQVEDILTIARLEKKEFEFKWETVDIHAIIKSAIESVMIQVEKREGAIYTELEAVNPMVTSDKIHFSNVIYNLLDNANKYSVEKPEITIGTKNVNNGVTISISDKGIGMNKNVQSKIFERFYRQTTGNIHNVKGFGLGLSYVKAVVEANNGHISVKSEPGKGSSFTLFVPFIR